MAYTTRALVKASLGIPTAVTTEDSAIDAAILAADASIDQYCGRTFEATANAVRVYQPTSAFLVYCDDLASTTVTVKTDDDDDGIYETTLTANTDYIVYGNTAPYRLIKNVNGGWPLSYYGRPTVQITGTFGYAAAVPSTVKQAALLLASRLYQRKASPLGFQAGVVSELGPVRISRNDPDVAAMLAGLRLFGVG
jgi:hypothetical protein